MFPSVVVPLANGSTPNAVEEDSCHSNTVPSRLPLARVRPLGRNSNAIDLTRMPVERLQMFSRISVPQSNVIVPTCPCDCAAIGTKRNAVDVRIPGKQVGFLMGHRIVKPNTDSTGDHEAGTIGRIHYFVYPALTKAQFGALG